jgi:ABC-type antimicrobial peptide transport system permease subunit
LLFQVPDEAVELLAEQVLRGAFLHVLQLAEQVSVLLDVPLADELVHPQLVGVLGVMNTMLMTVFERTHEICVLLAVGWKRSRIMQMILYESALLGFFGGIVGVAIGAIGVKVLSETPAIRGLLQPDLSIPLLGLSVVIAVAVGIISGLYPAWRSSRLMPSLALQAG